MVWHNRRQFVIWNYLNQWWPSLLTHICVTRSRENVDIVLLDFAFLSLHHHIYTALHWRHNESDNVSNHQRLDCLLNRLFRHRSKKISKLHVPGLCEWKPQMTGGSPHKGPVTRIIVPFDGVIMGLLLIYPCIIMTSGKESFCALPAFVRGIHRSPVDSPHTEPVTQTLMFVWC